MSEILRRVQALVRRGAYRVSQHGFRELVADDILAEGALAGAGAAVVIEDYPDTRKEPSILVLQHDREGRHPCHVGHSQSRGNARSARDCLPASARAVVS